MDETTEEQITSPVDEFDRLDRALRDLWEGCIPWHEAIEMIGAPEAYRPMLRKCWNRWNRRSRAY
jgi:hypothetical protein